MNFLEQLVAEWYEYDGYFVRTNIKFDARKNGGYNGEMDVVCYKPEENNFVHIEASTDSKTWRKRKEIFERKFTNARKFYKDLFPFKETDIEPRQIALVGFNVAKPEKYVGWKSKPPKNSIHGSIDIEVINIPKFVSDITNELKKLSPQRRAVPESYALLRAIQYSSYLSD